MNGLLALGLVTLLGCAGDGNDRSSGVEGGKLLINLSMAELDTFCAYVADISGPERTVVCDGMTIKAGKTKESCIAGAPTAADHPDCAATVAQAEMCFETAATADPCNPPAEPACNAIFTAECL